MPLIGCAETSGLIKEALYTVATHGRDQLFDKRRVDLRLLLQGTVAQHRNYEVNSINQLIEIDCLGDGTLLYLQIGIDDGKLCGATHKYPNLVSGPPSAGSKLDVAGFE